MSAVAVVVPTIGRPSLAELLRSLDREGFRDLAVVADDRARPDSPLDLPAIGFEVVTVASGGAGPAAARNAGWRHAAARPLAPVWIAFLDDDVVPEPGWVAALAEDLRSASPRTAAISGRVHVPQPAGLRPTDAERNVLALADARWITADMAVRTAVLREVGGFDERFRRAYREDTDLALRLLHAGWAIEDGRRSVTHPLRAGTWWSSVRAQRGNADDALMRRVHGPTWRRLGHAPPGALARHVATVALSGAATVGAVAGRRSLAVPAAAGAAASVGVFAARRIAAGPADVAEWARMASSSVLIPGAAVWWATIGWWRAQRVPAGVVS